jgi:hypothetical protein
VVSGVVRRVRDHGIAQLIVGRFSHTDYFGIGGLSP